MNKGKINYKSSGVNIDEGQKFIEDIKSLTKKRDLKNDSKKQAKRDPKRIFKIAKNHEKGCPETRSITRGLSEVVQGRQ